LAKESVRAVCLVDDVAEAADRLDNAIAACLAEAPEIVAMGRFNHYSGCCSTLAG
jgi:hypothetical protein